MTAYSHRVTELARDLVTIDSRSFVSNCPIAERVEAELAGFELERLDYNDRCSVAKRVLVAHRGPVGGVALSGHMDTVPDTGWSNDPWSGRIENGLLYGLGSADMKGPVAALIVGACARPERVPITPLLRQMRRPRRRGRLKSYAARNWLGRCGQAPSWWRSRRK